MQIADSFETDRYKCVVPTDRCYCAVCISDFQFETPCPEGKPNCRYHLDTDREKTFHRFLTYRVSLVYGKFDPKKALSWFFGCFPEVDKVLLLCNQINNALLEVQFWTEESCDSIQCNYPLLNN